MSAPALVLLFLLLPLVAAGLAVTQKALGHRVLGVAAVGAAGALAAVVALWLQHPAGGVTLVSWAWAPSLGVELAFRIDGHSLFYGALISGIGLLVVGYAWFYFAPHDDHTGDAGHGHDDHHHPAPPLHRFTAYLLVFMGAMLGAVFSDHALSLFVFWELTSIASFLLIGFEHGTEKARKGAQMALVTTGVTGLCLLAGLLLLWQQTGTGRISDWLAVHAAGQLELGHPLVQAGMVLVLVGAFGKSAQVPFHYWLPNAMAAPTPVSAYLHSATMVKLGVFLVGRFYPIFHEELTWEWMLAGAGFATCLLAAVFALLAHELKAILAYSTVSQLGLLMGIYALGSRVGLHYDHLHIVNHGLYKAALFMVVGIVMHATGEKDIRRLGGLWRQMPWAGVACLLGCLTMAGLPLTSGYLSKELLFKDLLDKDQVVFTSGWVFVGLVFLASVVKVAFSVRLFAHLFLRPPPKEVVTGEWHQASVGIQLPPLLLAFGAIALGVFPALFQPLLQSLAVPGTHDRGFLELAGLYELKPKVWLSVAIFGLGGALYWLLERARWRWSGIPPALLLENGFQKALYGNLDWAKWLTGTLGTDRPRRALQWVLLALAVGLVVATNLPGRIEATVTVGDTLAPLRWVVVGLTLACLAAIVLFRRWANQLIATSLVGFLVACYYALFRAPDLALTQLLVETVSLVVLLAVFLRVNPAPAKRMAGGGVAPWVAAAVAGLIGWGLSVLALAPSGFTSVGDRVLATTVTEAKGTNAVNTIIVDYRAFDTLGEVTVLVITAVACLALMRRPRPTMAPGSSGKEIGHG